MIKTDQKLYWVPTYWPNDRTSSGKEVTVKSVGRKWAKLNNGERIDIETLWADGGEYMSPGRCFLSKEEYEAKLALQQAWKIFTGSLPDQPPGPISMEALNEVKRILGLT